MNNNVEEKIDFIEYFGRFFKTGECYVLLKPEIFWDKETWCQYFNQNSISWPQVKNFHFKKNEIFTFIEILKVKGNICAVFLYDNKFLIAPGGVTRSIGDAKEYFCQITGLTDD